MIISKKNETGWNPNCAGNHSLKPKNPIELFSSFMVEQERHYNSWRNYQSQNLEARVLKEYLPNNT